MRNAQYAPRAASRRSDDQERGEAGACPEASIAPVQRPACGHRDHYANRRTEDEVQLVGVGENESRIDARARGQKRFDGAQRRVIEAPPQLGIEAHVEGPHGHPGDHCREHDVDVDVVDRVLPGQHLLRPQVEDPVGAHGGGSAVVHIEEPDGAVDEGEAHRQQSVDSAHGQAVEGEL